MIGVSDPAWANRLVTPADSVRMVGVAFGNFGPASFKLNLIPPRFEGRWMIAMLASRTAGLKSTRAGPGCKLR